MAEVPPFLWADAGSFTSPHKYTVPGAGEVQPYTATATYVNASGQAILPALRLKSSSGNLLALVFPSTAIADGASSEVSFVPPFGSAAVSASGAASLSYGTYLGTGPAGGNQHWGSVFTNDTATFSIDGADNTLAVVSTQGVYLVLLVGTVSVLTSPYTIPANQFQQVVETTSGAGVLTQTMMIKGQTDVTLPNAGADLQIGSELFPRSALTVPFKLRASHTPVDANLGIGSLLRLVKIA